MRACPRRSLADGLFRCLLHRSLSLEAAHAQHIPGMNGMHLGKRDGLAERGPQLVDKFILALDRVRGDARARLRVDRQGRLEIAKHADVVDDHPGRLAGRDTILPGCDLCCRLGGQGSTSATLVDLGGDIARQRISILF